MLVVSRAKCWFAVSVVKFSFVVVVVKEEAWLLAGQHLSLFRRRLAAPLFRAWQSEMSLVSFRYSLSEGRTRRPAQTR